MTVTDPMLGVFGGSRSTVGGSPFPPIADYGFILGPWHDDRPGSSSYRRAPTDHQAERVLLRTARCLSGSIDFVLECESAFDYGRRRGVWRHAGTPPDWPRSNPETGSLRSGWRPIWTCGSRVRVRWPAAGCGRVRSTVLAIADELSDDELVLRYRRVEETDDGFEGEEGTFTICSFWLVSALTEIGEVDRARALCTKLLSYASPLQLDAEEIDPTADCTSGTSLKPSRISR